jgi:hypothetical protein
MMPLATSTGVTARTGVAFRTSSKGRSWYSVGMRRAIAVSIWLFALGAGIGVPIWLIVEQDPWLGIPVGIVVALIVGGLVALLISYKRRGGT